MKRTAFLLALVLAAGPIHASDRALRFEEHAGTDFHGGDYAIEKDVSLVECKLACADDHRCKALTYDQRFSWCFLKNDGWTETKYSGAISLKAVEAGETDDLQIAIAEGILNGCEYGETVLNLEEKINEFYESHSAMRSQSTCLSAGDYTEFLLEVLGGRFSRVYVHSTGKEQPPPSIMRALIATSTTEVCL